MSDKNNMKVENVRGGRDIWIIQQIKEHPGRFVILFILLVAALLGIGRILTTVEQLDEKVITQGTPFVAVTPTIDLPAILEQFPTATDEETLVVVTQFLDSNGEDPQLFSQNLVNDLAEELKDYENIRIEWLDKVHISANGGSDQAMALGKDERVNASIVIWGNYTYPEQGEPQVHVHFDMIREQDTYLESGFYDRRNGTQLLMPTMFDFQVEMGRYLGKMVAFTVGIVLFEDYQSKDAIPYFDTAATATESDLAGKFITAIHFFRMTNYLYLGGVL